MGQTYTAYETSLLPAQRLAAPTLAEIQAAFTAAQTAQTSAGSGEAARATAAETYRQTLATARQRLEVALVHLKSKYVSNQAQLEQWGLDTVTGSRGINVRKPRSENEWAAFLAAYVTKETGLPAAEQIANPTLAEMTTLRNSLQTAQTARTAGRNQREANVQTRTTQAQRLLDLLQTAALVLVATRLNGVVTNDLQRWEYEVVAVTSTAVTPQPEP